MRKLVTTCLTAACVTAMVAGAAAATKSSSKGKSGGHHSTTGTIEAYDSASHNLTLKTAKATAQFTVGADTKVWVGSKSSSVDDLGSHTGAKATVSYSETGGQKTAHTVRVTLASTKPATTKSPPPKGQ